MTVLLALSSSLLWGAADFLGGTATRRLPAFVVIGAQQALALVVLLPIIVLTGAWRDPLAYLPWAAASGVVGLVALGAFYSALATGTMGVVAPIAATGIVVPVTVGVLSGDTPSVLQVAGIAAAFAGVVLASGPERGGQSATALRPLLLAGVAAVGFGVVVVLLAVAARSSVTMTLVVMRAESVALLVVALLLFPLRRGTSPQDSVGPGRALGVTRRDLPLLAAIGFGDAGANAAYAAATTSGDLSIVAVLGSLYPAVTVLLARQVHGERLRPVQTAGVTVALAGVVLIAAGGGAG